MIFSLLSNEALIEFMETVEALFIMMLLFELKSLLSNWQQTMGFTKKAPQQISMSICSVLHLIIVKPKVDLEKGFNKSIDSIIY